MCLEEPAPQLRAQRSLGGHGGVSQGGDDEGPESWTRCDEALALQFSVGLGDGVRVDRNASNDFLDGWELVAHLKKSKSQRSANLVNELQVGRDSGSRVEIEIDQAKLPFH